MIRPALCIIVAVYLTACGGDSYSEQDLTPAGSAGRQVGFEFINTTDNADNEIAFFVKESNKQSSLFDDSNKIDMNSDDQTHQYVHSWSTSTPLTVDIGALEINTQTELSTIERIVTNNGEHHWLILWFDTELEETVLFSSRQEESNLDDKYVVRIFSLQDIELRMLTSSSIGGKVTLQKGQLSSQLILDNCSGELVIDGEFIIDLCSEGINEPGASHLLIFDDGNLLVAEEK